MKMQSFVSLQTEVIENEEICVTPKDPFFDINSYFALHTGYRCNGR